MSRDILFGVVIGAQGLRGEVKVKAFTEDPERIGAYGALHARDGRKFVVRAARGLKGDVAAVRFEGVADRTAAESLKGVELFLPRDALPPPGDEEFYHADLVGLSAHDLEGRTLGIVSGMHNFGAGDVVKIARPDGDDIFLPFTRQTVPVVDVKGGIIVVLAPNEATEEDHPP